MSEETKRFEAVDRLAARMRDQRSPYREALDWIECHPGTGSAVSLSKLILSFWNGDAAFSFRECISNLDGHLTQVAVRMAAHFVEHGEDRELVEIGRKVCAAYPRLWELGAAADEAKAALSRRWRDEDREDEA